MEKYSLDQMEAIIGGSCLDDLYDYIGSYSPSNIFFTIEPTDSPIDWDDEIYALPSNHTIVVHYNNSKFRLINDLVSKSANIEADNNCNTVSVYHCWEQI